MARHGQYDERGAFLGVAEMGEEVIPADAGSGAEGPAEAPQDEGYAGLKKEELHDELDARGIEYAQRMTNAELVALLEEDDAAGEASGSEG